MITEPESLLPALYQASALSIPTMGQGSALVVVPDVPSYLATRQAVLRFEDERPLYNCLSAALRREVAALQDAFDRINDLVKSRVSVQKACAIILRSLRTWHWPLKTFRAKFDLWRARKDWTVLVNRSKANADWKETRAGLPAEFLQCCAARIGNYKRADARKEALRSILRQWHTGRTFDGRAEPVPGYGWKKDWLKKNVGDVPAGWSYSNIMRQIKTRNVLPEAARMFLLQGTHAAKEFVPDVLGETKDLRFLEEVQFDDVKTDWRIFDPATGQSMDLWLLIARDRATRMLLGFGMRPARAREDGSQEHLKLRDMKQLCGWLLERYGLPPYTMVWKIERGTATLSAGSAAALQEMLGTRIKISFSSMIGGTSPAGYFERRIGNSKGKASLESHNRGMHLIGASIAGQTGPAYGARPADLAAREKECTEICALSDFLPEQLRGQLNYSLLTLGQARENLFKIFHLQNSRDDHTMEGFQEVLEWYDGSKWQPQNTCPLDATLRRRMETPIERAARLVSGLEYTRVSPDIITAFYEHTQRPVKINDSGEIEFHHEGKKLTFANPNPSHRPHASHLLAYCHPDDPTFLHLTDGQGAIIGTWLLRGKIKSGDTEALAQAIRYQATAMKAARETAEELNAGEREQLDAMRAHNTAIMSQNDFVDVAEISSAPSRNKTSGVATGLAAIKKQKATTRAAAQQRASADAELVREHGAAAADDILASVPDRVSPCPSTPDSTAGDDLLNTLIQ